MKKTFYLFLIMVVLFCGCSKKENLNNLAVGNFSYENDFAAYDSEPGTKKSGFVNTENAEIKDTKSVVELAEKECTVKYDAVTVAYDEKMKIYRVCFYQEKVVGGDQSVYINQNGITELIVYSE